MLLVFFRAIIRTKGGEKISEKMLEWPPLQIVALSSGVQILGCVHVLEKFRWDLFLSSKKGAEHFWGDYSGRFSDPSLALFCIVSYWWWNFFSEAILICRRASLEVKNMQPVPVRWSNLPSYGSWPVCEQTPSRRKGAAKVWTQTAFHLFSAMHMAFLEAQQRYFSS